MLPSPENRCYKKPTCLLILKNWNKLSGAKAHLDQSVHSQEPGAGTTLGTTVVQRIRGSYIASLIISNSCDL